MDNHLLQEVACPNCQNPIDIREHGKHITCDACGSHFLLNGHLCPQCNSYHQDEELFCGQCGAALTRTCRRCKASNWSAEETCTQCGAAMDIFDLLSLQHETTRRKAKEEREVEIRALRAQEEVAAVKRMEELREIEEQRRRFISQQLEVRRRQDNRLLLIAVTAIAVFVVLVLAYAVFLSLT